VQPRSEEELIREIDAEHARLAASHRRLLRLLADVDRRTSWRDVGARDTAHWLSIRYGVSQWKARRWIAAAHALETLPRTAEAVASGELHVDKAVELTRFATPETESRLLVWAGGVSCGAIRRKADVVARRSSGEAEGAERSRFLSWWTFDEGRRFGLEAELPRPGRGRRQGARPARGRPAGHAGRARAGRCRCSAGRCPRRPVFVRGRRRS
jgi:hypothetical protein